MTDEPFGAYAYLNESVGKIGLQKRNGGKIDRWTNLVGVCGDACDAWKPKIERLERKSRFVHEDDEETSETSIDVNRNVVLQSKLKKNPADVTESDNTDGLRDVHYEPLRLQKCGP